MDLVTGAIGSIIPKLAELLKEEFKLQTGLKNQVESLTAELKSAHAFLQEIDKVPPDQLNEQVKIWACEVREASYDMEDILDTFLVGVKGSKPVKKNKLKRLREKMASFFSKTKARHDIANAIDEVNKKLMEIAERRRRYKLDDCVASPAATPSLFIDPRIALVHSTNASMLIGIDEPKDALMKMLSHDDMPVKTTKVISLLGFGGLGKTTLAKATYDEEKQQYQCGAFVSVGRNPNLVKVFKDILFHLDKKFEVIHSTQIDEHLLIPRLVEFLGDKRYLIVIDDVWETQSMKRITEALPQNNIGSRIIITTRKSEVAIGEVYKLQPLSDDNSKRLFYARIFGGEEKCPDNQRQKVSEVAHKILRKCGGVPLAVITMASLLVGKSMQEWFEICNSIGFRDKDKQQIDDTMWILSLSYYDLPSHLKTCSMYLSVFPEDYHIEKDTLIWMWIAEGFINGKPRFGLFEIGEGYFNDLINRSLIQPAVEYKTKRGMIVGCRVHDMILDLIRSLTCEANFATVLDNKEDTLFDNNARRLALQHKVMENTPQDNHTDKARVRSFIAFGCIFGSLAVLGSFKLLRVLHLEGCRRIKFDVLVGDLLHLRYLGIWDVVNAQFVKGLGNLRELMVLRTSIDGMGKRMQSDFLKCLGNLDKMQRLELDGLMDKEALEEGLLPPASCIDPLRLRNLTNLSLVVDDLGDKGLEILGGLPELRYLELKMWYGRATITGTAAHGYFPKLRFCWLPYSIVQFAANNEDSSLSFTIWGLNNDGLDPAFSSKQKQYKCTVPQAIMPILEYLHFKVHLAALTEWNNGSCDNLVLELPSLQKVRVDLKCYGIAVDVVEKEVAALRHAMQVHPNRPTLEIDARNLGEGLNSYEVYLKKKYGEEALYSGDEESGQEEELDEEALSASDEGLTRSRRSD